MDYLTNFEIPEGVKTGGSPLIEVAIKVTPGEKIHFHYFSRSDNVVVLTNQRFVKVEDGKVVSEVYLKDVATVNHIKNGIFQWDKVSVTTHQGCTETFGINFGHITAFFTQVLRKMVENYREVPVKSTRGEESPKVSKTASSTQKMRCARCHRNNHTVDKCYARTTLSGDKL